MRCTIVAGAAASAAPAAEAAGTFFIDLRSNSGGVSVFPCSERLLLALRIRQRASAFSYGVVPFGTYQSVVASPEKPGEAKCD